jgi:hypothetical protein
MLRGKKTPQDWFEDIDNALEYRRIFAREDAWNRCEQNYLNDPRGHTALGPNLVYEMADSLTATLTVPDPEFVVTAERIAGLPKAPIIESMDNYFIRKLRMKKYVDVGLLRGFIYGNIILKIGYDSEFGWAPNYDIGQGQQLMGMTFTQFNKRGRRIESPDYQPGWPWIRPMLPHDFVVPWGTMFLEDAPWAACRIIRHVNHFKNDAKYKNTSSLKPQISMRDFMESYMVTGGQKQRFRRNQSRKTGRYTAQNKPEFIEAWEIVDRMNGERIVITRDYTRYLRKSPDAIQMACGMPYVTGTLSLSPRSFWSVAPAYYLGQHQKEQFDISLQAGKERRINIAKFLYRKGAISKEEFSKLLSGDVGAAAAVDTNFPLNEVIANLPRNVSYDYITQAEENRRNARSVSGMSRNQAGEFVKGRKTAAETRSVALGSGRRTSKRGQVIAGIYTDAIEKVNSMVFNFWNVPREVMHKEGFEIVTGEMLKGDYQYDVSLATKRIISRAERKVEALMLTSQIMALLGPGVDPQSIFKYVIDAAGDPAFEAMLAPGAGRMRGGQGGAVRGQPALPQGQGAAV